MSCDQCELLRINGVLCHETGCPEAWRDYGRECQWCGTIFPPQHQDQLYCDESCAAAYCGYPDPMDAALDACDGDVDLTD